MQSGFSLLARGEPQIWFTGGMLVVCIAMIVGLLTLIVTSGLPTFWPKRLDVLVLNDGSLEIGQPQSTRQGGPLPDGDQSPTAAAESSNEDRLSHYYRTANNDLTGQHYRWLDATQMDTTGITTPAEAIVVERLEWGRLYGFPLDITQRISISPEAEASLREIDGILAALEQLPASEADEVAETASTTPALANIREQLTALRQQLLDSALRDELSKVTSPDAQVQTAGIEEWLAASPLPADTQLTAARQYWTEPTLVLEQLQRAVAAATEARRELKHAMVEISRLDAQISRQQAAVRRAELEVEQSAARRVEESQTLLDQLVQLQTTESTFQQAAEQLPKLLGSGAEVDAAVAALNAYRDQDLPEQIAALEKQLEDWLEPIRQQPAAIVAAVLEFQSRFREIARAKLPLQSAAEQIQKKLDAVEVTFAVPTGGDPLYDLPPEEVTELLNGAFSESLQQQLADRGIAVPPTASSTAGIEVTELNPHMKLVTFRDQAQHKHLVAVTRADYMANPDASAWRVLLLPEKSHSAEELVRVVPVNQLSLSGKFGVYFSRWGEFLWDDPREAGTEGGVFPAIWGTVVMTLIMTIAVVPFGVMAALYLREYTRPGPLVSLIRISINNLAGVPSIVYGVFGFSFFCYTIGAFIDGGPKNADLLVVPPTIWYVYLSITAIVGTSAFFLSFLASGPGHTQTGAKRWMSRLALVLWLVSLTALAWLILKSPFFDGFYREYLPNPTFGKGGLLWAALTLSLLTLPVVIVATEEALAAVPNSLREGSLACGASKWQTIRRIILPQARPGILTGAILAMARGAGEVAPLMLVGALPMAPDLPLDTEFPFFHGSRSFMHLGYQIFTLGFQSQNSEAAKPMVFTCTLLLITIIAMLNISAIYLRARLRRRFRGSQF
jgi:ABC-type phosphate transport system permease subunit/ABC-type phosphate transport system auxiliary subunit